MTIVAGASALLVSLTLAAAGLGKLRNLPAARTTAVQLGVPPPLARLVVAITVAGEVVAAALLLAPGSLRPGAAVALVLLGGFSLATAGALRRGRRPTCACFGQKDAAVMGIGTLLRNGVLLLAAVFAISPAAPSFWLEGLRAASHLALVLGGGVLAGVSVWAWVTLELLRQHGRLLLRLEAVERQVLSAGPTASSLRLRAEPAGLPNAAVRDSGGRPWSLPDLHTPGEPLLVLFTDADCPTCRDLLPGVLAAERSRSLGAGLVVLSRQPVDHPGARCFVDDGEAAGQLGVTGVPTALLVDAAGRMPYEPAAGPRAVAALLEVCRGRSPFPPTVVASRPTS